VELEAGEDWRWDSMVSEGPGDFLDARAPGWFDDGGVVKTQLTRLSVMVGAVYVLAANVNFSTAPAQQSACAPLRLRPEKNAMWPITIGDVGPLG
jgi:hypothetical protein